MKPKKKKTGQDGERFTALDVVKAIWYFLDTDRKAYVLFSGLLLIVLGYEFLPPWIIGQIVNFLGTYQKGADFTGVLVLAGILVVSNIIIAAIRIYSKKYLQDYSVNSRYRAKVWGFERLLNLSLSWHQKESTGNKAQRLLTGSESLREWTRDLINIILPTVISFTGTFVSCMLLSPYFIFFFLWYLGIFTIIENWFDRQIARLSDEINSSMENASGTFVEGTSNILSVKALGAGKSIANTVMNREEIAKRLSRERNRIGSRKWLYFQAHNSVSWGLYIGGVVLAAVSGHLEPGLALTYFMYFSNMRTNVTHFVEQIQIMIERKSALCRMMPIFSEKPQDYPGTQPFPDGWKELAFDNITFGYGKENALEGMNLSIRRGEKIGIAGHSGSGKSTLIKLILGLYQPVSGTIRIGDIPVDDIRHDDLLARISVVLQETELFNLSLHDNVTMMREVDESTFEQACKIACIDELIARLPAGADTILGERGYSLSGGERQRVGIARALCRSTEILLLDEATSALDGATEDAIMKGLLGPYGRDKTIIMIAHRTVTLKHTDRILVFERGSLRETGTWESLFGLKNA